MELLLPKDAQHEVGVAVLQEGCGDDDILARFKVKATADLTEVDKAVGAGHVRMVAEVAQRELVAAVLCLGWERNYTVKPWFDSRFFSYHSTG